MRRFSVLASVLVVAVLLSFGTARVTAAQEATPAPDNSPNPEECVMEPRALEDLQLMVGTPHPAGAGEASAIARAATPASFQLPQGEPPDAATVEAITQLIRHQFACHNAGHYLAGFAGTTDEFISSQVGTALFDADLVAVLEATPQPLAEELQTQLLEVSDVTIHPDGRAGALVHYLSPTGPCDSLHPTGQETDLWIFEQQPDGQWLLDEVVENLEGQHGPLATPTA